MGCRPGAALHWFPWCHFIMFDLKEEVVYVLQQMMWHSCHVYAYPRNIFFQFIEWRDDAPGTYSFSQQRMAFKSTL